MTDIQTTLSEIQTILDSAPQTPELEFRLRLEALLQRGQREVHQLIMQHMVTESTPKATRINLIRIASYVRDPEYLVPLKRIIDSDPDLALKKAAIICVAKYRDRRALMILSTALERIKQPEVHEALRLEIDKIRHNNPVIALTPAFLKGSKSAQTHQVVRKVFCKIVSAADAKGFIPFLEQGDQLVEEGAFEILCHRGDAEVQPFVVIHFQNRLTSLDWHDPLVVSKVTRLLQALWEYCRRYPTCATALQSELNLLGKKIMADPVTDLIKRILGHQWL